MLERFIALSLPEAPLYIICTRQNPLYAVLGILFRSSNMPGLMLVLHQGALGDAIDAMVSRSRCEAQNPGVGRPQGGTQITASRCREGALTTSRGITHCTHVVSQRCRERMIARIPLTSTGWFPSMSRGGARAMLARA
jgi:hypothetical protein